MTASVEVLGRAQAPDIWSTPLQLEEPAAEPPIEVVDDPPRPAIASVASDDDRSADTVAASIDAAAAAEAPIFSVVTETGSIEQQPALTEQASPAQPAESAVPQPSAQTAIAVPPTLSFRSVTGKWAAHRAACSERNKRTVFLPLTIHERGARAGSASCSFQRTSPHGKGWSVAATCSNKGERWTAHVRLVLAGDKLTWSSERGTSTYLRCP